MRVPLILAPGIVSDDTTFATPGNWADGNNMRPWRGSMQTIGGWSKLTGGLPGVCRSLTSWTDNAGNVTTAFGTNSHLYIRRNGVDYDITPDEDFSPGSADGAGGPGFGSGAWGAGPYGGGVATAYYALTWSLANWGENLLANPRGQSIFIWENDTSQEAIRIASAPDNITSMLMNAQRQVMAFGCNEEISGDFNAMCIRWSDIQDYDDWTTYPDGSAGEYILPGAGQIVSARLIGPYVAVWTDNSLYLGQYIGTIGEIWRFERVAEHCGLVSPNAVVVLNQTAYWVTPDYQFYGWTPGIPPQMIPCPIRNDFKGNIASSQREKICGTSIAQYGEIWWFYPDRRDGLEASRYVAFSVAENAWFRGRMARSACADAGPTQFPLFVTPDGNVFWHENGQTADGGPLAWSLRSSAQYIDNAERFVLIKGLWPDFEDQHGGASLRMFLRKYPQDTTVYEKGPYSLPVNRRKADFMASARVAEVEFSGDSAPSFVRFGKPQFDIQITGRE